MAANDASQKKTAAKRTQKKRPTKNAQKDLQKAAATAAAEMVGESTEEAQKMQEGFIAAQASRSIEVPLVVYHSDDDGRLVEGVENFRADRWTMTMTMVLQKSLQRIQNAFAALLPRMAVSQKVKEGETTNVELRKLFEQEEAILEGMMAVWPDIMKVVVGTLASSNKDRFESDEECRTYLEEHCQPPQMLELAILLSSMNQPPKAGKKGALASLFRTVGSQRPS